MNRRPFELPDAWEWANWRDVASVAANLVDPKTRPLAAHIAPNHIESRTGKLLAYTTVQEDKVTSAKQAFHPGQILYSKIRPYLAKAVIVNFEGLCSADMYPVDAHVDTSFLFRWMLSPWFTEEASRSQGRTVLPKINRTGLEGLMVPVAPANEQRRIAEQIDALFAHSKKAKESLDRIPALLEKLKRSILAAAFRGDLTKDWRTQNPDVEPASVLLERIRAERRRRWEEAELEKMRAKGKAPTDDRWKAKYEDVAPATATWEAPAGWAWCRIDEAGDVQLGRQRAPQYLTGRWSRPYLRVANVKEDRLSFDDVETMDFDPRDLEKYALRAGDILLSEGQSPSLLGESAIYSGHVEGLCYQKTLHRFRPLDSITTTAFAQLQFMHMRRAGVFRLNGSLTTNMAHLTLVRLRAIGFAVPPLAEQQEIINRVRGAFGKLAAIATGVRSSGQRAVTLEAAALAKAFRGELVPQDPNDEPASVLLARIREQRAAEEASPSRPRGRRPRAAPKAEAASAQPDKQAEAVVADTLDLVVAALVERGKLTSEEARAATGLSPQDLRSVFKSLAAAGKVRVRGKARGTAYEWVG